jgi:hypothetical protein
MPVLGCPGPTMRWTIKMGMPRLKARVAIADTGRLANAGMKNRFNRLFIARVSGQVLNDWWPKPFCEGHRHPFPQAN